MSDAPPLASYDDVGVDGSEAPDHELVALTDDAAPELRWRAFCAQLGAAKLDALTHGDPMLVPGLLRVRFKRARKVAELRRFQEDPRVDAALRACYPVGTALELAVLAPRGSDADALLREAQADPSLRRIAETLGATFVQAKPLPAKEIL